MRRHVASAAVALNTDTVSLSGVLKVSQLPKSLRQRATVYADAQFDLAFEIAIVDQLFCIGRRDGELALSPRIIALPASQAPPDSLAAL